MPQVLLVTGSSGLIGSEVCVYFARELGYQVHGLDNNNRAVFFGPQGFMAAFAAAPRAGEVYNLGGGKANSCSILEAFQLVEAISGRPPCFSYVDQARLAIVGRGGRPLPSRAGPRAGT